MASQTRPALLVIDVQQDLFSKKQPVYHAEHLLNHINQLLDAFHQKGWPVFFIRHTNDTSMVQDTPGWQVHADLHSASGDTFLNKHKSSLFQEKVCKAALDGAGVNPLVVTGLVTQGCVQAGSLDGLKLGYRVILVEDAHSTFHEQAETLIPEWNEKLAAAGAKVVSTDKIMDLLSE